MLHQLLFGLLGRPGSIIKHINNSFCIDPSLPLHPQTTLLNELLRTGHDYYVICQFITSNLTSTDASMYRRATAHGLRHYLLTYECTIKGVEEAYLSNRYFSYPTLRAELSPYDTVLREISSFVLDIAQEKGGVVVDQLARLRNISSELSMQWLDHCLKECITVFINQVRSWVLMGQLVDPNEQFCIRSIVKDCRSELVDWEMYAVAHKMVPHSIIEETTARKLLFIGKSVKILRKIRGAEIELQINRELEEIFKCQSPIIQNILAAAIERIRSHVAALMIQWVVDDKNLLKQIEVVNRYDLMFCGQFYHHFFEEARGIEKITLKEKVQKKVNQTYLSNTLLKLGMQEDIKKIRFQIRSLGFNYANFRHFLDIIPVGDAELIEETSHVNTTQFTKTMNATGLNMTHLNPSAPQRHNTIVNLQKIIPQHNTSSACIKLTSSQSAVWHRSKQLIQANFSVVFIVRLPQGYEQRPHSKQSLAYVLQNSRQISTSSHNNPLCCAQIPQYLSLVVRYRENAVQLVSKSDRSGKLQRCLCQLKCKAVNLSDSMPHTIKLQYQSNTMKVSVDGESVEYKNMKVENYLTLELGRAYVGLVSQCNGTVEVLQWEMVSKHIGDYWSDLTLCVRVDWPVSLILTPDMMDTFARIHKFLFPIRQAQIQIEHLWSRVKRKINEEEQDLNIRIFERRFSATRFKMNLFLNNLWEYLQCDVLQNAWRKLKGCIGDTKDFQSVIGMIAKYARSIQVMFFFNVSRIQKMIEEIVKTCKNFVFFFQKIEGEEIVRAVYQEYELIEEQYNSQISDFYHLLKQLCKTGGSHHLYHLTQRMEACLLL